MRTTIAMLAVLCALTGCSRESPPGGPGVGNGGDGRKPKVQTEEATFRLTVPSTVTNIQQGAKEKVTIHLSRGSAFKETVKLTFKPPQGVTVTPESATLKQAEEETTVTVEAAADAQPGKAQVEVTGTPDVGRATSTHFDIEVTKKEKSSGE